MFFLNRLAWRDCAFTGVQHLSLACFVTTKESKCQNSSVHIVLYHALQRMAMLLCNVRRCNGRDQQFELSKSRPLEPLQMWQLLRHVHMLLSHGQVLLRMLFDLRRAISVSSNSGTSELFTLQVPLDIFATKSRTASNKSQNASFKFSFCEHSQFTR